MNDNKNINYNFSNDLNISNSSDKELNDILTEDLLTYSEDKSQSLKNIHQIIDKNNQIINNHNQSLKNIISKNDNNIEINNNEKLLNNQKNYKIEKGINFIHLKERNLENENKDINNGTSKDLSALQISLSNLLSDIDSKETIIYNNNIKDNFIENNNIINIKGKNDNNLKSNYLIDISNEKSRSNLSISNNNSYINNNNNNAKNKNIQNEEHSSVFSLCNYSQSLFINNNTVNNVNNNIIYYNNNTNKNSFNIDSNYNLNQNIYNNSNSNSNKKSLKYNKDQNINIFINSKEERNKKRRKVLLIKKDLNELNNKNYKICTSTTNKNNFKIEKPENIQLSIISNTKKIYNDNYTNNYNDNLSINKELFFTINNSSMSKNINDYYYNIKKNNTIATPQEMIREQTRSQKLNGIIKNKIKLINNKNIEVQKEESKKFFYNPKLNGNKNQLKNNIKENYSSNNSKIDCNMKYINKKEILNKHIEKLNNNNKNLILNLNNNIKKEDNKKNPTPYNNINKI